MKKTLIVFAIAATVGVAFAAEPAKPKAASQTSDPYVVTFANGSGIRQSELEAAMKTLPQEYQAFMQSPEGKRAFADEYLKMKLLSAEAEKAGLEKDPEVVNGLKMARENVLANAEIKKLGSDIKVADADIQKMYDERKASFDTVKARHILIAFKGSPAARPGKDLTEEQAKAKAEEIKARLAKGEDFAAIAKAESDDTGSGAKGGDLGTFSRGQMVPEFENAAFAAKPGDITVVKSQFGYHIVQVQEHKTTTFEEAKPQLEREAKQKKMQEAVDSLRTNAKPVYNDSYFGALPAPEQPPAQKPPAQKPPVQEQPKKQ